MVKNKTPENSDSQSNLQFWLELYPTAEAAKLLTCSPKKLYRQRHSSYLKIGIHFIDRRSPNSSFADLHSDVVAIRQAWSFPKKEIFPGFQAGLLASH